MPAAERQAGAMAATQLRCPACGLGFSVTARADGTLPATVRCPKPRGGCGWVVHTPRSGRAPGQRLPAVRSEPGARKAPGRKPGRKPGKAVARRPAERGTVTSRSPRDNDGTAPASAAVVIAPRPGDIAARRSRMLAELAGLLSDHWLTEDSRKTLSWYAAEVAAAADGARLDELIAQAREERLEREDPWAEPPEIDVAAEMRRRGYRVQKQAPLGGCAIVEQDSGPCQLKAEAALDGIRVCCLHRHALAG